MGVPGFMLRRIDSTLCRCQQGSHKHQRATHNAFLDALLAALSGAPINIHEDKMGGL